MLTLKIINNYCDENGFDTLSTYITELPNDPELVLSLKAYGGKE